MKPYIIILIFAFFIISCDDDNVVVSTTNNNNNNNNNQNNDTDISYEWLIPVEEVFDGGPGKDGIPALTNPMLLKATDADYLDNSDLILGIVSGSEIVAYPHKILDWHEIINSSVGVHHISVTYCPLTGTGIGWNRNINGMITTFGVSGLLYNSNLIPYDRSTDSYWSQIRSDCVYGELAGNTVENIKLIETTWETWKTMYPSTLVVGDNIRYNREYDIYPYGNYNVVEWLLFPVNPLDNRLHLKERVHGIIINNKAKAYKFSSFINQNVLITDNFEGSELLIVGNSTKNFIISFFNDNSLVFEAVQDQLPIVLSDNEGNKWDVWGVALEGPRTGEQLTNTNSFMGYWFSWGAFFPDLEIYE